MTPEAADAAVRSYAQELNRLNREHRSSTAIAEGMYHPSMKEKMTGLETRKQELTALLADAPKDMPDMLPNAAVVYAKKIACLIDALNQPEERQEAAATMRTLIEKIVLMPGPNRGEIDAMLYGELGTILNWIERQDISKGGKKTKPAAFATGLSVSMVAGAGFEPAAFRL
ncbi:Resolvase domain (fragment) [uncultured Pleomorphomonas sp.]|uniref:Resolvase domain n=1 Tax=uncultured Pleomorphomonas sp. TaxID=442121 RepID=A0A212LGR1_9HYPH